MDLLARFPGQQITRPVNTVDCVAEIAAEKLKQRINARVSRAIDAFAQRRRAY